MTDIDRSNYELFEFDVDDKTGASAIKGPIQITGAPLGAVIIGTAYDPAYNSGDGGWRILILLPGAD